MISLSNGEDAFEAKEHERGSQVSGAQQTTGGAAKRHSVRYAFSAISEKAGNQSPDTSYFRKTDEILQLL
jgi:hypothetical protein